MNWAGVRHAALRNDPGINVISHLGTRFLHHNKFVLSAMCKGCEAHFIAATANEETSKLACNFVIV
jgi:hypothetical protein